MTQPEDGLIQATVSLADTPIGQKVALTLLILLGRDVALGVGDAITKTAKAMSGAGLVIASGTGTAPDE